MSHTHCSYCDREFDDEIKRTKDHIIPRVVIGNGGGHNNITHVCRRCNELKGSMTPQAMRALAVELDKRAALIRRIADRVDRIMKMRGL